MVRKVFVEVNVKCDTEGSMIPLSITWEDGRLFEIDKVTDIRKAASLKAGGIGVRYTIMTNRKQTYLWYEDGGWFVEGL